ncbi:MAG: flagellar basal-body MS-ring/collar protein FliF, partial [Planctomycetota bacterium]
MKFSQFTSQAKAIWSSMGAGSRLTLLSFLGIMVVLLVLLAFWAGQTDYALLHAGLSPEEAATVSDKLRDDKVPFHYEASRGAIYVPASRVDAVKLSLATMGIPHSGDTAFDKFDKQAFGTTEYVQKINFVRAQEASLAHTIMAIEGVESARVKLAIPDEEVFIREKREAKASVTVTLRRDKALSGENVNAIKYLVASSVPKLDARNVKPPPFFQVKAPVGAPNVLIVLIDDMGFGQSSAFGGPIHMPTVDALANE